MILLMPLAGRGSRFLAQGYAVPKPLIEIKGKPMIQWAFDSVPNLKYDKLIFVILKEHNEKHNLSSELKKLFPEAVVVLQDGFVDGAVKTCLFAKDIIDSEEPLVIYNPDQYFGGPSSAEIEKHFSEGIDGLISTFYATHPKWSYAAVDEKGFVTKVAEKDPISTNATVGMYIFRKGKDFVWGAEEMIRKDIKVNNEFYVCPVYNELLARGGKLRIIPTPFMWGLGTPEDVAYFEKSYLP